MRSKEDGQLYAVKKSKEYFRSKEYRRERLEEVKRYEEFSGHEHCVTMYKAWEQDYQLYMQMELCHGSLEGYVMEQKLIPEPQIWSFLLDLLLALKGFHDRNLIHLDVKLDNILITEDGVCKLGDFGLMFDLQRETEKAVEGDCRYIAPEELEGRFTKAADIFSLGITILELSCNLELPANGVLWQQLRTGIFPPEIVNCRSHQCLIGVAFDWILCFVHYSASRRSVPNHSDDDGSQLERPADRGSVVGLSPAAGQLAGPPKVGDSK